MVCNNSTIKYVLRRTLACKVSGHQQHPFWNWKKKKTGEHSICKHFKNGLNACELVDVLASELRYGEICSHTRGALQVSSVVLSLTDKILMPC